jgi:hypothetical protein
MQRYRFYIEASADAEATLADAAGTDRSAEEAMASVTSHCHARCVPLAVAATRRSARLGSTP